MSNILTAENINKSFGEKAVLSNISFGVDSADKIGIIGINGTGKSTLLKIIAGVEEADSGEVIKQRDLRVSYLPQTPVFIDGEVVIDYMNRICDPQSPEEDSNVKSILTKIGITDYYKPVSELSGGGRKRVALAAALISKVDLLILDEPTNHIDSKTVEWLEGMLKTTAKALILVTHDRYFLDRVANKIIELDKGRMFTYEGNYSVFLEKKAEREELEASSERKRKSFLRTELEWIRRGARARTTKQKARIERFEEISAIKAPQESQSIEFKGMASRLGGKTVIAENISKSYDGETVVNGFSYIINKADRLGIVGDNGCGKTTLINMLCGKLAPDSGSVDFGETVKIGVFAQENNDVEKNVEQRTIDYIRDVAEYIQNGNDKMSASQLMERFLFNGEMQYSPISKLSGGEKRRLYLLKVLMSAPNILFLDEPTNDLDIETLTILEDYIAGFKGAVVIVSHDRYFLDKCVDRIFAFENGGIKQYEGNYADYAAKKTEELRPEKKEKTQKTWDKGERKLRMTYNEEKEYKTIDADIEALETRIAELEAEMEKSAASYTKLQELMQEKEKAEEKLAEKMDRWVYLTELAEKIKSI
ncbi:MAG: ABC-F family ATP-binding cassette domain-containing protein [Firmicutes bacterium]|nr:ABC-F family ATP-binding cassette domain-containing protein [Bacillota bacterium]